MGEGRTGATGGDRRRLTVPEAADALGITVDAVRGRIRRRKLEAEREEGAVYVWVDLDEGADRRGPSETSQRPSGDESERIADLHAHIADLRGQLDAERAAHEQTRRLLGGALERIPAIEAPPETPRDAPESPTGADEGRGSSVPADQETADTRPWWRRLFEG